SPPTVRPAQSAGAMRPLIRGPAAALAQLGVAASSQRTLAAVADGTSNTLLLSEDAGRPIRYINGRAFPDRFTNGAGWGDLFAEYGLDGITVTTDANGNLKDNEPGNCAINCSNNNETYAIHSGGAHHVDVDASGHFLKAA